ncbi:quinone oxidoreductase family protein [Gordonia sp. DT219]|uniref:quinone oxidoreductase family protein n=1 Tax=Gordonia sp. DT219 TaxID=3416658 RepID=UPI003CF3B94A
MRARGWVALGPRGIDDFAVADIEVPAPASGEVTIEVVSAGVNPADLKHARAATDFPAPLGYEISGRITALGAETDIASGPAAVGDEVLAFRVHGGYARARTVAAETVFAKPASLDFDQAAGLLLAGSTAADMLRAARATRDEMIVLHGASGAVGVAVLQLARLRGIHVIGTAGHRSRDRVRGFGGMPVEYGPGVLDRIRASADGTPIAAALDAVGTDEAIDASLELVADRSRIVTVAAPRRAGADGFTALGGQQPQSRMFRDSVRSNLIRLAGNGDMVVPVAATFPFDDAREAVALAAGGHAGGKVVIRADR